MLVVGVHGVLYVWLFVVVVWLLAFRFSLCVCCRVCHSCQVRVVLLVCGVRGVFVVHVFCVVWCVLCVCCCLLMCGVAGLCVRVCVWFGCVV